MADWEKTIIPLDDAHEVFGSFGIGPESNAYQRWRRDDGFRWVDLEDVLSESSLVLAVDWRECLQDAMEIVGSQLESLGISLEAELDEDGNQGHITIHGGKAPVKFVPDDSDNFDTIIRSINRLLNAQAEYRKFRSSEGSDGWRYGLLTNEDWMGLELAAPSTLNLLFLPA